MSLLQLRLSILCFARHKQAFQWQSIENAHVILSSCCLYDALWALRRRTQWHLGVACFLPVR